MATITVQIPNAQVAWFEQMVHSLGWAFHREETPKISSAEKRTLKAIEELESGKGIVCNSFEEYLKAVG